MEEPNTKTTSEGIDSPASRRGKQTRGLRAAVGVEITYRSIYIVLLKFSSDGKARCQKCGTYDFDPSLEIDSPAFSSILKKALAEFSPSSKELHVWACPKLDRARLHHLKVPKVKPSGLPGAVYWALQKEDEFVEEETIVDFEVEQGGESGPILEITGALVERECVESVKKGFAQSTYSLEGIGLPLLGLRNLVKLNAGQESQGPVMICQLGQLSTSVSVLLKGRLVFTRNIPSGLDSLSAALTHESDPALSEQEGCERVLDLGGAEENGGSFGKNFGDGDESESREKAFTLLVPVLERTVRQIERTIEYFQNNFGSESIETVFLGGEIAARGKLFDFFAEKLSPEVLAIDPFHGVELGDHASVPKEKAERVVYGPAFGLALEANQAGINLANTYQERQREGAENKFSTIASILLLLLALAAALYYNSQRASLGELKVEKEKLEATLESLGPRITESLVTKTNQEVKVLGERRKAAINRYEALALLSEVTRLTPENVSLLHVSAAMEGGITFFDPAAQNIKVTSGKAVADRKGTLLLRGVVTGERTSLETSLTIYIARLDQSRLLTEIEVESTELVQSEGRLHLTFTLKVETVTEPESSENQ